MHGHALKVSDSTRFFTVVGVVCMIFGCLISLFDLMYSPLPSAILSLLFLIIGGVCSMVGVGGYLQAMDDAYISSPSGEGAHSSERHDSAISSH